MSPGALSQPSTSLKTPVSSLPDGLCPPGHDVRVKTLDGQVSVIDQGHAGPDTQRRVTGSAGLGTILVDRQVAAQFVRVGGGHLERPRQQIGRASCRAKARQYGRNTGVGM